MGYRYLLDIALILLSTKLLGMLTRKFQLPQVVGALLAGLLLGPACFNVIHQTDFIKQLAELGVIVLMFSAGLETDINELKKSGLASFIIAMFGVVVPLGGGFLLASAFNTGSDTTTILQNVFIGVILTATSVSITVETLKELGKLTTKTGNAILSAALIDDILGIIALTVVISFASSGGGSIDSKEILTIILKILGFFAFSIVVAVLFSYFVKPWINKYRKDLRRFCILAFFLCLIMAYVAERVFGVSDITGAFVAGLILSSTNKSSYMLNRFGTMSYLLLSPIFFASVGLKAVISGMNAQILIFSLCLVLVAILAKIIGCGIGAKICKYTNTQALKIGVGMAARGEVALVVASKGAAAGLMKEEWFTPIIIMVVCTAILTPILLKLVYKQQEKKSLELAGEDHNSTLIDKYEEKHQIEIITQNVIQEHEDLKSQIANKNKNK